MSGNDLSGGSGVSGDGSFGQSPLQGPDKHGTGKPAQPLSFRLSENVVRFEELFADNADIVFLHWNYGPGLQHKACSVYFNTLVQGGSGIINFMKSALQDLVPHEVGPGTTITPEDVITFFGSHGVSEKKATLVDDMDRAIDSILDGCIVIFFDGWEKALKYNAASVETRQITEPVTESVVVGPRESTVENLEKNIALIRIRLKSPKFKIKTLTAGGETGTRVAYSYIDGTVDPELLAEFERRMEQIGQYDILETSYIEQLIEDSTYSPFPQHRYTERPDTAVAALLDGKIAVLVQGTGSILLCPGKFPEFFQSAEDYYQRTAISTMVRLLRIFAFIIALTLPSIYVALTTFHPELIPTVLLISIVNAREGIPFPAYVEAMIMEFFFELLREAGIRLPRPVGPAISIVGGIVIGDAAIRAAITSPIMVITVALTGIASFAIPQYNIAIALRILRFPLMLSAATMGGFGMLIFLLLVLLHLCKLRTLGQPYLAPLAPFRIGQMKDVFVRMPMKMQLRHSRNHHDHKPAKSRG